MNLSFLVLTAVVPFQAPAPAHEMQTTGTHRIEASITVDVRYPNLKAKEWVLVAPQAPELAGQRQVRTLLEPAGVPAKELSFLGRPVLLGRIGIQGAAGEKEMTIRVVYQAELLARQLTPIKPGSKVVPIKDLPAEKRKQALRTTDLHNYNDPSFQGWLTAAGLRPQVGEVDVDFARRVFLKIQKNFKYEYKSRMDRHAAAVCKTGKSDCGGMSVVFVSAMRANSIPARVLVGRWAIPGAANKPTRVGEVLVPDYGDQHAIAEFYAQGVGWVPVDPASGVVHDKSAEGLEYFGRSKGNFLTMHVDEEMIIDSVHFGRHSIPWMQGPVWWATGSGNLDQPQIKETWQVKKLPQP